MPLIFIKFVKIYSQIIFSPSFCMWLRFSCGLLVTRVEQKAWGVLPTLCYKQTAISIWTEFGFSLVSSLWGKLAALFWEYCSRFFKRYMTGNWSLLSRPIQEFRLPKLMPVIQWAKDYSPVGPSEEKVFLIDN